MNIPQSPTSAACHRFSLYSTRNPNELKKCKDCRFYGGERCNVYNVPQSSNSAACSYGSICK